MLPRTRKLEVVTEPVDRAFFNDLMKWRLDIARSIARNNPDVTSDTLNEAVNDLLNRILFIRIIEDRGIEPYTILYGEWRKWQREQRGPLWAYLLELFAKLNPKYNGALFRKPEDDPLSNLIIDDKPLHNLIKNLYYPDSPYQFSALPVEIIGNAYERYLGSVLRITPARRVKLEEKPEVRKAGGVYYTPKYIVDYIVEQTLGRLLEGKKPKDVRKIKVLDPACGSGSFLIGAYERIMKYYIDYYTTHPEENKGYVIETRDGNKKLSLKLKKQILVDNIYGVDIDQRAVDMAQFSLYVKMMEGEEFRSLFGEGVLPDLRDNIVCGNSLVGWDILDMGILPDDIDERNKILAKINPMNWEDAFPDVFRRKELKAYHVTWVTRNSRVSEEIVKFGKKGGVPVLMDEAAQEIVTEAILEKAKMMNIPVMALSVLSDHVHILIACEESELEKVVQELKGYSSFVLGRRLKSSVAGLGRQRKHWAKGYSATYIRDDKHLRNVIEYIQNNHIKHHQKRNPRLQSWKPVPPDEAFSDKYAIAGGFDVVVGNPPYVLLQDELRDDFLLSFYKEKYKAASYKIDTYHLFIEKGILLLKENGMFSMITPSNFLTNNYLKVLRHFLLSKTIIDHIVVIDGGVFHGVSVNNAIPVIKYGKKKNYKFKIKIMKTDGSKLYESKSYTISKTESLKNEFILFTGSQTKENQAILDKSEVNAVKLKEIAYVNFGKQLRNRKVYINDVIHVENERSIPKKYKACVTGRDINRYYLKWSGNACYNVSKEAKRGGCWDEEKHDRKNKLLTKQIGEYPSFALDSKGYHCLNTVFMVNIFDNRYSPLYLLGILNSKLLRFIWIIKYYDKRKTFPKIKGTYLKQLPIRKINFSNPSDKAKHDRMVELVDEMLALHKKFHETTDEKMKRIIQKQIEITDKKIDALVYELYGLTEEEIKVVEEGLSSI